MGRKIDISIIIPAYNEEKRLGLFLEQVISYCRNSEKVYEIIIVDDGSKDKTFDIAVSYKNKFPNLNVIQISRNAGKGYAVKRGLFEATGNICLFMDADGSVAPEEIEKNIHYITEENYDIFIGSRVLTNNGQMLKVRWYRKFIGAVFNFFVHTFLNENIQDTQCGFKIFKRDIITPIFSRNYLRGFGFDVEVLYLAHKMGYKIKEGPVSWHHVGGSKINLLADSIKMFFNILQVRNWHYTPINPDCKYMGPDEYRYMYDLEAYHWWFVCRNNLVLHLIKSFKVSSPVILDAGCGTGMNLLAFNKIGEAFGFDISRQAVEFCLKRGLNHVIQCPIENIEYKDKKFDIITCLDVLEHVPNSHHALLELKRVLKDDGRMIITVPAFRMLWSQHDDALCHLRRYEKYSFLQELNEAGLRVEKIGYYFFTSFFAVAPIRIIRRFLGNRHTLCSDTTTLPPKLLNECMKLLFDMEIKISCHVELPFGTTLYAVVSPE